MLRKITVVLFLTLLFSSVGAVYAYELPTPPAVSARNVVLQNLETGSVIYEKNSTDRIYPASTVKMMTAIVAMENIADLDEQITATASALSNITGNNIAIVEGETFSARDLLYAIIIGNSNDAAYVLAEYVAGSVDAFVQMMNYKAEEIGMHGTNYTNPTGLHNDLMYTTAADVAKLSMYAYNTNMFIEMSSVSKWTIEKTNKNNGRRPILNRNHFVSQASEKRYYYKYARGLNAGSTTEAGYCLSTIAEQKGLSYLCVIMGDTAETDMSGNETINSFINAKRLFDWIFGSYQYQKILDKKDIIEEIPVELSVKQDFILLAPEKNIEALVPIGVDRKTDIVRSYKIFDERIVAPIKKGQVLGTITVSFEDKILGETNLVAQSSVERSNVLYFLDQVKQIMNQRWFKASAVALAIFAVFYALTSAVSYGRRKKRKF